MTSGGIRNIGIVKNNHCANCGIEKSDEQFGWRLAKRKMLPDVKVLQRWCKKCRVESNRGYYSRRKMK